MVDAGDTATIIPPVAPTIRWGAIRERFLVDATLSAIPVISADGEVLRVLLRHQVLAMASSRYGYALLNGRRLAELLTTPPCDRQPRTCRHDDNIEAVASRFIAPDLPWQDAVVVVLREGVYAGLLTYPNLITALLHRSQSQADELARARDEALAGLRTKTALLANVSHELRTPLTSILGFGELLAEEIEAGSRRALAYQVQTSGRHLLALLEDLLEGARMEASGLVLNQAPFAPRRLVCDVAAMLTPTAGAKGLTVGVDIAEAVPDLVVGDERRLRQIITNLAGNAVKFTDRGTVAIRLTDGPCSDTSQVMLHGRIIDSGPGISTSLKQRLFTPFTQGDESLTRRHGGFGLGLAITKHLVELMGGTITCDNQPGGGASFSFNVRCGRLPSAAQRSL